MNLVQEIIALLTITAITRRQGLDYAILSHNLVLQLSYVNYLVQETKGLLAITSITRRQVLDFVILSHYLQKQKRGWLMHTLFKIRQQNFGTLYTDFNKHAELSRIKIAQNK